MKTKIKIILSALIIQGCFFSTASAEWINQGSIYPDTYASCSLAWFYNNGAEGKTGVSNMRESDPVVNSYQADGTTPSNITVRIDYSINYYPYTDQYLYTVCNYSGAPWPEGAIYDTSTGSYTIPVDCTSGAIPTSLVAQYSNATGDNPSEIDIAGCGYGTPTAIMCFSDNTCVATFIATGSESTATAIDGIAQPATEANPYINEVSETPTNTFDTDTTTIDHGDGTSTDTTTDLSNFDSGTKQTVFSDGGQIINKIDTGTQTTTSTVTTTDNNVDGSSSSTSTTSRTKSSGGLTTDITDTSTGQTTNVTNPPVVTTLNNTTTTTYDPAGNVLSSNTTGDLLTEEPTDPNDASDVPSTDSYVNGDYSSYDNSISALSTPFNTDTLEKPVLNLNINTLGSCDNSNYSINVLGSTFSPDLCFWIVLIQSVLYWFFAALTAIFLFKTASGMRIMN